MLLDFLLEAFCFSGLNISLVLQFLDSLFICEVGGIVCPSCGVGLSRDDFLVFVHVFLVLATGLVEGSCSVSQLLYPFFLLIE